MTKFSETNVLHTRCPMGQVQDDRDFSMGTRWPQAKSDAGFMPFRELLSNLLPHASTGKELDAKVSPTKLKTKAIERAIRRQRNCPNRRQAWPPRWARPLTSRAHLSKRHPPGSHKARSGRTIVQGARHGLYQLPRPRHTRSTFAPRPPRTSSTHDEHFQATYTGTSPVEVRANMISTSDVHWGMPD
ncbi:hypothetical protein CRG98_014604 [Punica granatum]|uniref:Uncharacterized protein n=1 Tax=Punica granatum TaxID=22663 RepID=A0A2I0K906_PUNGR|nr:hypothetical protein CRG98_014604 [Punica granatum]